MEYLELCNLELTEEDLKAMDFIKVLEKPEEEPHDNGLMQKLIDSKRLDSRVTLDMSEYIKHDNLPRLNPFWYLCCHSPIIAFGFRFNGKGYRFSVHPACGSTFKATLYPNADTKIDVNCNERSVERSMLLPALRKYGIYSDKDITVYQTGAGEVADETVFPRIEIESDVLFDMTIRSCDSYKELETFYIPKGELLEWLDPNYLINYCAKYELEKSKKKAAAKKCGFAAS